LAELKVVRAEAPVPSSGSLRSQVIQPSVRTYTIWTPTRIRAAEIEADGGSMRRVANLCDWLLGDDRIRGCLDVRAQALFGLDPKFEPSGDKRRSNRAVRALEADEDWWDSYPEAENTLLVIWGILLGFAPGRNRWEDGGPQHGGRVLAKPEFWHPQHTRYDWTTRRWLTKVATPTTDFGVNEVEIVAGDGDWILHTPYGPNRPWSMGLWRGLARLALLKSYAQSDWARLGESASRNVVESTVDSQGNVVDTKENRQELADDIAALGRDGTIVLPPMYTYKLVEASAVTKDIYDQQIKMANEAIAISIRGGNLSTNVTEGSFAAAKAQSQMGDQAKLRFDAQAFTTTIHDQSLIMWAELNFGDPGLAPWPVYPVQQEEDLKSKAEAMAKAAESLIQFQALGFDIDREGFAETFQLSDFLKVPKGEDTIAPKPAPLPAPAAAPTDTKKPDATVKPDAL
jgi:phage gp29-like protein